MDYTGSIYRLIDRAEDEMKEYAQRVKQLSADEIYRNHTGAVCVDPLPGKGKPAFCSYP